LELKAKGREGAIIFKRSVCGFSARGDTYSGIVVFGALASDPFGSSSNDGTLPLRHSLKGNWPWPQGDAAFPGTDRVAAPARNGATCHKR
jgi:hypothetical protein